MKRLRGAGINMSPEEAVLMNQLWDKGEQTLSELADWSVKDSSTLSRQIGGLVRKGYVNRRESTVDRRNQVISISEQGHAIREQFLQAKLHLIDDALTMMSDSDYEVALRVIKVIRDNALAELCTNSVQATCGQP